MDKIYIIEIEESTNYENLGTIIEPYFFESYLDAHDYITKQGFKHDGFFSDDEKVFDSKYISDNGQVVYNSAIIRGLARHI